MDCQEFEALSGAYALDAITDDERREANTHLAHCLKCQHVLLELRTAANLLPLSVAPVEPSPHLKERLFAAIRTEAPRKIMPQRSWWQRWNTPLLVAIVAFLCVLLAGMAVWNISLQRQIALQLHPVSAPVSYVLHGTTGTNVTGELIYLPQMHLTTLILHGLSSLHSPHIYQGWLLKNRRPRSIGMLHMEDEAATLNFSGDVQGYDTVVVSIEAGPQASQATPKGEIVATGPLGYPQTKT